MKRRESYRAPRAHTKSADFPNGEPQCSLRAGLLVSTLLDGPASNFVGEASLHRSTRGKVWIACFARAEGGQRWRSTGLTDHDQAMTIALAWEREEQERRARLGWVRKKTPANYVRRSRNALPGAGPFTQEETALILGLSVRAVRAIEHRALKKLRDHPALKELWGDYTRKVQEALSDDLDPVEIAAMFDLARTAEEFAVVEKIVAALNRLGCFQPAAPDTILSVPGAPH